MKRAMGTSEAPRTLRTTLPARAYTDGAWFAIEMDRVLARMWLAAGRVDQLDHAGAFIRRDVAGASVLIVRAGDGSIRAHHNVCRHRGTRLSVEERGTFQGSIQCPYHAWTYGLDGRLLAAQLGDLPSRFAPWAMQDLRLAHRIEYDVATNWKLVVQNYNECLHCPVIHPLLNRMHHYLGAENVPPAETYCGGAMGFKDGVETLSTDGKRRREFLPGLRGRDREVVNYFAIYPNFLLTLHPDYMMTITIWPRDCGRTTLVAEWHFHPDEMKKKDFVCADAIDFWDRTNREDWAISEQSYLGISSRGYQPGPYSERERQLWEFDQFVLARVNQSP